MVAICAILVGTAIRVTVVAAARADAIATGVAAMSAIAGMIGMLAMVAGMAYSAGCCHGGLGMSASTAKVDADPLFIYNNPMGRPQRCAAWPT